MTILGWLNAAEADRILLFEGYRSSFLTQAGEPSKRLIPKALDAASADALLREQARLVRVGQALKALEVARRTSILLTVGYVVIDSYALAKRHAAALDFDDLIARSERLLRDPARRDWVRFKLDARIDHLLVDEAQDTSPAQWAIIEHWSRSSMPGRGRSGGRARSSSSATRSSRSTASRVPISKASPPSASA
jgi:ATP-dependent helicase/nuclease subunit A